MAQWNTLMSYLVQLYITVSSLSLSPLPLSLSLIIYFHDYFEPQNDFEIVSRPEIVEKKNTTIIDINLLILDVQVFREKSLLKLKVKHAKIILLMLLGDAHPAVHRIPSVQKYFGTFPQT